MWRRTWPRRRREFAIPIVYVYCEKVVNDLREKFRTFSGTADLCVEIRVSHEHMDDLTVLTPDVCRGGDGRTWTSDEDSGRKGIFYTGGYEIQFSPIKRGGRNFRPGGQSRANSQRECGVSRINVLLHIIK